MSADRPVALVDSQALQYPLSAERGIGRYLGELLTALRASSAGIELSYALNPDLPITQLVEPLLVSGAAIPSDRLGSRPGDLFHVPSPFEPAPIDRLWPPAVRHLPLVVTVHDLIPFVLNDLYLQSASERRWYRTRLELVRRADRVIAVSQATANDVVEITGIDSERVTVVSEGPAERFKPLPDRSVGMRALTRALPRLHADFVLYPGGMDPRKNISRLLEAYAGLPAELRRQNQLVITGKLTDWDRRQVERMITGLGVGVGEDVLFSGHVSEEVLLRLFQTAKLTVFPSLYEGFGLPVAESLACGTPVIASDSSSLPELIQDPEALFDPRDASEIQRKLERVLTDPKLYERLRRARLDPRHSWREAALGTAAVYRSVVRSTRRPARHTRRLGLVVTGPVAGDRIGAARLFNLASAVSRRCAVDLFSRKATSLLPSGVDRYHAARFNVISRGRGGYDAVLSMLAEDDDGTAVVEFVRTFGGSVLLERPSLVAFYAELARRRSKEKPGGFPGEVESMYGSALPRHLREAPITESVVEQRGVLMARELMELAERVYVQSEYARRRLELDGDPRDAAKVEVLPLAYPRPRSARREGTAVVGARVANAGALETLLDALADVAQEDEKVQFRLVLSRRGRGLRSTATSLAAERGLSARTRIASEGESDVWQSWVADAQVAVELGDVRTLAVSDFVTESVAGGVPTVVSDVGALRELPDDAVAKVTVEADSAQVAATVLELMVDESRASELAAAAQEHAREQSVDVLAERLLGSLGVEVGAAARG